MKRPQDPERMRKVLAQRERHGWTWAELSRRSGLPVWKLHFWRRRLSGKTRPRSRKTSPGPLVAVEVVETPSAAPPLEVVTRSGVRVVVGVEFDAEHLRRVLRAVDGGC